MIMNKNLSAYFSLLFAASCFMSCSQQNKQLKLIFTGMAYLLTFVISFGQTTVSGGWKEFGIQNNDTTITMDCQEICTDNRSLLFYGDYRSSFDISLEMRFNTLVTEQVFLNKEGKSGELFADLSVGFDPSTEQIFAEVKDSNAQLHRIVTGAKVRAGEWFDVNISAKHEENKGKSEMTLVVREQSSGNKQQTSICYPGYCLPYNVTKWVIGHGFPGGFPNSLQVRKGEIRNIHIAGIGNTRVKGQNPIFTDRFTADPACTVVGNRLYAYVGEDKANVGGWFTMPHWIAYSTDNMIDWTCHGIVLNAKDFAYANPNGAWAAQMVERNGKFYYYVTLDDKESKLHTIDVAVADSPTGPFVPARKDGTPLITDDMTTTSHRWNSDIDPTVFIDDDGQAWMAWGNGDCYIVKLKDNMIELDGEIHHLGLRNYSEGPWLFKRNGTYYMVYAADAPGVQTEQMAYATAENLLGPWKYRGLLSSCAKYGFTIHPSINEFKGKWYFFYHDGSYMLNGEPGGDCRRQVCVEEMTFNADGTIQPIVLTEMGIAK